MGVGWEWDWVLNWFGIGTGQEWISVGVGGSGIYFDHCPRDWEGLGLVGWEWEGAGVKMHSCVTLY